MKKFLLGALVLTAAVAAGLGACSRRGAGGGQGDLLQIAENRGLSPEDAARAIKTFVPPGGRDEYLLFASGGHSGQVHVLGVPSLRLLKTIAVFTPEPWQGYGYGADWSEEALNGGSNPNPGEDLRWGDSHHPALSETDGKYDGRWLYINDRAHGRIGMVDLRVFPGRRPETAGFLEVLSRTTAGVANSGPGVPGGPHARLLRLRGVETDPSRGGAPGVPPGELRAAIPR